MAPAVRMRNLWWAPAGEAAQPAEAGRAAARVRRVLEAAGAVEGADLPPEDMSMADFLRARGLDDDALAVAEVLVGQTCCAPLRELYRR